LEDRERLVEVLGSSEMVFVTAGMGGGTGTGGAPVIARIARELGALTVAVVTRPFHFEGKKRRMQAEHGIAELRAAVDTMIIIPNQRLLSVAGQTTTMIETFRKADEVLFHAVRGISDLITVHGLINLDFADVRTIMAGQGMALMGTGEATGDDRAVQAAKMAISSPLLEEVALRGAMGVLINITSGPGLTLFEVNEASTIIQEEAHEDANIIFGAVIDEEMGDKVRVTVIATGFQPEEIPLHLSPLPPQLHQTPAQQQPLITRPALRHKTVVQPVTEPPQPTKMGAMALEVTQRPLGAPGMPAGVSASSRAGAARSGSNEGIFGAAARRFRALRSGSGAGASRNPGLFGGADENASNMRMTARKELFEKNRENELEGVELLQEDEYDIPTFLRKQAD
jgi:cell division protein FtsZ